MDLVGQMLLVFTVMMPCWAVDPAECSGAHAAIDMTRHLSFLPDPGSSLTFETVSSPEYAVRFEAIRTERLNFGIIEGVRWIRFQVRNTGASPVDQFLEIERTTMDGLELYKEGGSPAAFPQVVRSDTLFYERPVPARQPVFRIDLAPGELATYFLRINTVGATGTDVTLLAPGLFRERESSRIMAMGLYFGMLLIMIAHYLLMFGIFRERSFLFLAAVVFSTLVYVATYKGYTFQFIWPESANLSQRFTLPWAGIMFAFAALFAERFLDARTNSPKLARVLFGIAALGFCIPIVNALDAMWTDRISYAIGITMPLVVFAAAINGLRNGKRAAWIFLAGWSLLLLSAAVYSVAGLGYIPDNFVTSNGPLLAFPVMLLMLSLATWDRFKSLEEHHRDSLELRVEERTRELAAALENVRTLEGFIPICSHCKKVRDDAGFWSQIEHYISTHSGAAFSHSICPDCLEVHYPEFASGCKNKAEARDECR